MGSVVAFVVGVFLGIVITAFFFRRSNILYHKRGRQHRQRRSFHLEESQNEIKDSECVIICITPDYLELLYARAVTVGDLNSSSLVPNR